MFVFGTTPPRPPLHLNHSISITVQHLIQSELSVRSIWPTASQSTLPYYSVPILTIISTIISAFLSFKDNWHIHVLTLISLLSILISCSIFIGQVLLPYLSQLLTHNVHTLSFSFNENQNELCTTPNQYSNFLHCQTHDMQHKCNTKVTI